MKELTVSSRRETQRKFPPGSWAIWWHSGTYHCKLVIGWHQTPSRLRYLGHGILEAGTGWATTVLYGGKLIDVDWIIMEKRMTLEEYERLCL